jgi:uncharacterized protein with FMN-binding domain
MAHGSSRRIANNLVALSSAAVLTVYAAGYLKTKAAAEQIEKAEHRETASRPALRAPAPDTAAPPVSREVPQPATPAPVVARKAPEPRRPAPPPTPVPETPVAAVPVAAPVASPATPVETPPTTTIAPPDTDPKPVEPPAPKPNVLKDGTYTGWGNSRHGSIQASVTIENGKIASAAIVQCLTRYSCSVIAHLVPQVAARQSANVDYVSGATQSAEAFYDAVVEALSKAK